MKTSKLILMFVIVFAMVAIAEVFQLSTIGISNKDVNSLPTVIVDVNMMTDGNLYLLDNPEIGVKTCKTKKLPKPIAELSEGLNSLTLLQDPNLIDFAGTGRSFGFGISGTFETATIIVNDKKYNFQGDTSESDRWDLLLKKLTGQTVSEIKYYRNGTSSIYHWMPDCRYIKDTSTEITEFEASSMIRCKRCTFLESKE